MEAKLIPNTKTPACYVVLPEDAQNIELKITPTPRLIFRSGFGRYRVFLPPGIVWTEVFKASEATEEQAAKIVENYGERKSRKGVNFLTRMKANFFTNFRLSNGTPAQSKVQNVYILIGKEK